MSANIVKKFGNLVLVSERKDVFNYHDENGYHGIDLFRKKLRVFSFCGEDEEGLYFSGYEWFPEFLNLKDAKRFLKIYQKEGISCLKKFNMTREEALRACKKGL